MSAEADQTRREFLEEVVRNQPDDTFARYGLAMELANSGTHCSLDPLLVPA